MHVRIVREQGVCGLLRLIQASCVDEINDAVGGVVQTLIVPLRLHS